MNTKLQHDITQFQLRIDQWSKACDESNFTNMELAIQSVKAYAERVQASLRSLGPGGIK